MKVQNFSEKGVKKEDKTVKADIFEAAVNPALIHEVVIAQMANRRLASAKAKTRAEVSGGGIKPFKQKGTGRARSGSIRNPLWRGGGIVFGPTGEQNFTQDIPKKKRRQALISALSSKKDAVVAVEAIKAEKTKEYAELLGKVAGEAKALVIYNGLKDLDIRTSRNLKRIKVTDYRNLNVYDVLNADKLVFVGDSLDATIDFLGVK
jgi:large subunit ribosomal protein L4